jgi:hypothetical protein
MNLESLHQKLIAAARANPPGDRVPYAFEKRIVARLKELPAFDVSAVWARALWRAAALCVVLTLLLGVWSLIGVHHTTAATNANNSNNEEFSLHFEQTMLAAVNESAVKESEEVW